MDIQSGFSSVSSMHDVSSGETSHVLPTLDSFRNKLLDLTTRNNLLNLGLNSKRTSRLMRFIDCNLQSVLDGLVNGRQYTLQGLPEPPIDKQLEFNDELVEEALTQARSKDPLYQQILADASGGSVAEEALLQADERLRASVLEELGKTFVDYQLAKNLHLWAESQGINPSFVLPVRKGKKSHQGSITSLLLHQRMERIAEAIRKQAQSSIEETGNNILYLAFGCLEWFDRGKRFFAPLLMIPVDLVKAVNQGGARIFCLGASDDAVIANQTLKERLKRDFGLDLPMPAHYGSDLILADYFQLVSASVADLEGWSVQPFLNLALFNFSGLGLYQDLIPELVEESPLVRQLLSVGGEDQQFDRNLVPIAEDVNVDQPSITEHVPVLIAQADASQFAAVADVMAGRSMVIEGPPGTGKSQTITNIIANCLYAGKRILFVAEKKVALDVVYRRLSEAGLRPFCLRIESDKASKKQVYGDLAERLDLASPCQPNREGVLNSFNELRDDLNKFASLVNLRHGHEDFSQFDLLWQDLQLRSEFVAISSDSLFHQSEIIGALSIDPVSINRNSQIFDELAQLLDGLDREKLRLTFQPIGIKPVDALGREQLLDHAQNWERSLITLASTLRKFTVCDSLSLCDLRQAATNTVDTVLKLPEPLPVSAESLLPVLASPGIAAKARTLLDALHSEMELQDVVQKRFITNQDPIPSLEQIRGFLDALNKWKFGSVVFPSEQHARDDLHQRLKNADQIAERIEVLLESSNVAFPFEVYCPRSLIMMLPLLEHLSAQPDWLLHQRGEMIWKADPVKARALVDEYNILHQLQLQLKLDQANSQQPSNFNFTQAIDQFQHCFDRGLQSFIADSDAYQKWCQQIDQAQGLLEHVNLALSSCLPRSLRDIATIDQLVALAGLLRSVLELNEDSLALRTSQLWGTDLDALHSYLKSEQELKSREQALNQSGFHVIDGVAAADLREAADLLEAKPLFENLFHQLSGSKGRSIQLAEAVGANTHETRCTALRDVAKVLELREVYNARWKKDLFNIELPSEKILQIAEQLQLLDHTLRTTTHGEFWSQWLRETEADTLRAVLSVFEQELNTSLQVLADHAIWSVPTAGCTMTALQERLNISRKDQLLLAEVAPVARWAEAADLTDGYAMMDWLKRVQQTTLRTSEFPYHDLDALLANGLVVDQINSVLIAAEKARELAASAGLGDQEAYFLTADQHSLAQVFHTLRDQLLPLVQGLIEHIDGLFVDVELNPLNSTLHSIQEASQEYQGLLQLWMDIGIRVETSLLDLRQLPIDLALALRRKREATQALEIFQQQAGPEVAGVSAELIRQTIAWISDLRQANLPGELEARCLKPGSASFIVQQRSQASQLQSALKDEGIDSEAFLEIAQLDAALIGDGSTDLIHELPVTSLHQWINTVVDSRMHYPIWVQSHQALDQLPTDGTREVADLLFDSSLESIHWSQFYRWIVVRSQLRQMSQDFPELTNLRCCDQSSKRDLFQSVEEELRSLDRAEVIASIYRDPNTLPLGVSKGLRGDFTEMSLIFNECRKKKRHRPLRHLFQFAGESLRGLKPCWMMSPSTVASLVPRELDEQFDLVIVDEASQMPPERAIGLISRARQCVVVGDPNQLPPTSRFQRVAAFEDADTEMLDEESILDLCTKIFNPIRRLKWHYRSRHGSLISFSNNHFYGNELVVFPSSNREFAIHRHFVSEASFAKGVNLVEAKVVCDVVLEQLEKFPGRSLGVVAMNEAQASAIGEQLEMLALHHEELQKRLELRDSSEELFVKALEKVQGDERDTIVISYTYGPSEPGGPVAMRFGPINLQGGHRRLNVLFSRAKRAIELVTSIEFDQIKPTPTSSQGVHAFRNYLRFVDQQVSESSSFPVRQPSSSFELVVADVIRRHGYEVECHVGVANYFIDLAIRHPNDPGSYVLGLECDGATYCSARAARDRDKYRQEVLEGLGWNIYRIWSMDWFENPELESTKLINYLKRLL